MTAFKVKRLRTIFIVYWFLLAYVIAALIWWFIALNQTNSILTDYKTEQLKKDSPGYPEQVQKLLNEKKRKTTQYLGEGGIFLLLILAGAVFVYRSVRRQFRQSQQQQNLMMAITHELKTPIAVTKLNLETLLKHRLDEVKQQKLIQNTLQEADRLNDLCNNLLLSSQIEAGGYNVIDEMVDLGELSTACIMDYKTRYHGRDISQDVNGAYYVTGDKMLLQMAINNLLDNAIKYSPKESHVKLTLSNTNSQVLLEVKDEGKGIDDPEKTKVFKKYYRIGNLHTRGAKGTGLGLYLTKKIVEQHKATITVTNNIPQGSVFTISFPAPMDVVKY